MVNLLTLDLKTSEIVSVKNILNIIKDNWPGFDWTKIDKTIKNETDLLVLNTNKANKVLKWNTRLSVSDAVKLTIHWYKEFYRKSSNNNLMTNLTKNK